MSSILGQGSAKFHSKMIISETCEAFENRAVVILEPGIDLKSLFLIIIHGEMRFSAGILSILSEVGVGLLLLGLAPFWTGNLMSSAQKWQHGFSDLVERAAP